MEFGRAIGREGSKKGVDLFLATHPDLLRFQDQEGSVICYLSFVICHLSFVIC